MILTRVVIRVNFHRPFLGLILIRLRLWFPAGIRTMVP